MKEKRVWYQSRVLICFLILFAGELFSCCTCLAAVKSGDFASLKKALETPGKADIRLCDNIQITSAIHVRGEKKIKGNGYCVSRGKVSGKLFAGTLFSVDSGEFSIQEMIVSGAGDESENARIYGRLVDVKKGRFVLLDKAVLTNNCNTDYAEEGGGAVYVRKKGIFLMKAGQINKNKTVTEGAAVYIDKGGIFRMKGGIIQNNISRGIGAIEGFDGRGGAVYNQGTVVISDGLLRENCAIGFQTKKTRYGGAGGMLYNEGRCVIAGGTIEKNVSSYGGGAIYSSTGSVLRITDGNFQGNQAEVGGTIFFCGKSCYLNLQLNEKEFYNATTKKTERTGKKPQNPSEPVEKKNADSAKTKKKKTLVWKWDKKKRIYYTGEYLTAKLFKYGIRATADGKDMTGYISLSRISGVLDKVSAPHGSFSASAAGNGILHFQIRGYSQELSVPYEIRKNHEVNIRIAPRYLFLWEVADCSLKRWKELVREGIVIEEKEDRAEQLWSRATIDYGAARSGKAGTYTIKISLRDQWGHRFYMKRGLYKRYGAGKIVCAEVPLTLVSLNDSEETEFGVVQFLPEYEQIEEVVEVWTFSSSELIQIGNYTEQAEDPFSENTNIGFLNLWEGNRNSLAEGG